MVAFSGGKNDGKFSNNKETYDQAESRETQRREEHVVIFRGVRQSWNLRTYDRGKTKSAEMAAKINKFRKVVKKLGGFVKRRFHPKSTPGN